METHKLFKDAERDDYFMAMSSSDETVLIDVRSSKAYKCKWSEDIIQQAKDNLGSSSQEIENWRKDLKNSSKDFIVSISESCESLVWKKNGRTKVRIAEIPLESINYPEALEKLFEIGLQDKVEKEMHKRNFERIAEERKDMQLRMKTMTEDKINLESSLYSKFLAIDNAKQDYIAELLERIKELEEVAESSGPSPSKKQKLNIDASEKPSKIHTISSSSEDEAESKCDSSLNLNNSQNLFNL